MIRCGWEGCTEELSLRIYDNGSKYQPKYCDEHVSTAKRKGALTRKVEIGATKPDSHGYTLVFTENGWEAEHRLLMENYLGRPLREGESVYHKNTKRDDNRIENLELRSGLGVALEDLTCPHCGSAYV